MHIDFPTSSSPQLFQCSLFLLNSKKDSATSLRGEDWNRNSQVVAAKSEVGMKIDDTKLTFCRETMLQPLLELLFPLEYKAVALFLRINATGLVAAPLCKPLPDVLFTP